MPEQKLKILVLNHEFPPVGGGASPVTFELCKQLVSMGHHIDVVTMRFKDLPKYEVVDGINIYRTPAIRKKKDICHTHELATYLPGALKKTLYLARKNKYDIIHCHFVVPGGILAWLVSKITKIPFIVTCHGTDIPGHNPERFGLVHKLITPIWRFIAKSSAVLVAPSDSLRKLIVQNCPTANTLVIPNGLHARQFNPAKKTKSILMCSRIFEFKGFQYAIKAIKEMNPDWQVNVVGDGPFLPHLKKLAEGSKTPIKFWGWLDKTDPKFFDLYNQSSIFIFPSEAESFGMVLAEAMAAGNAIIASDIPAHREVVGESGLFVPAGNSAQIQQHLQSLIGDDKLRQDLQDSARQRVLEKFSWEVVVNQYTDSYKSVLEHKKQ